MPCIAKKQRSEATRPFFALHSKKAKKLLRCGLRTGFLFVISMYVSLACCAPLSVVLVHTVDCESCRSQSSAYPAFTEAGAVRLGYCGLFISGYSVFTPNAHSLVQHEAGLPHLPLSIRNEARTRERSDRELFFIGKTLSSLRGP